MIIFLYFEKFWRSKNLYLANWGFFDQKDNRGPPPPPPLTDFCKNDLYEGIDLETSHQASWKNVEVAKVGEVLLQGIRHNYAQAK